MKTRQSLVRLIPWNHLGFEVAGAFADGDTALTFIKQHPCDVVMTDIMMSKMNGLELTEQLHSVSPEPKVIILSGYNNFTYAQQAIRHKVVDYLLKPINEDDLVAAFCKLKEQLDDEMDEEAQRRESREVLQSSFFRNLLAGRIASESELEVYLRMLGMRQSLKNSPTIACDIAILCELDVDDEETGDAVNTALREKLNEYFSENTAVLYFVLQDERWKWRILAVANEEMELTRLRQTFEERLQLFLTEQRTVSSYQVSTVFTHVVSQMSLFLREQPEQASEQTLVNQDVDRVLYEKLLLQYKIFVVELDMEHAERVREMLNKMAQELERLPIEHTKFIMKNLYALIEEEYNQRNIDIRVLTDGRFNADRLHSATTFSELMQEVQEDFSQLRKSISSVKASYNTDILGLIIQYIEGNPGGDLTCNAVATKFRIHPSHLSRTFKQRTGENMQEYVTRIRIEKAIQLLEEGKYTNEEISRMVGFNSASYFSRKFRKVTGYAPRDYCYRVLE